MDKWDEAQIGHYMGIGIQFIFSFLIFVDSAFWLHLFVSYFVSEMRLGSLLML